MKRIGGIFFTILLNYTSVNGNSLPSAKNRYTENFFINGISIIPHLAPDIISSLLQGKKIASLGSF